MRRLGHRCRCILHFGFQGARGLSRRGLDSNSGLWRRRPGSDLWFSLRSARTCRPRRSWGFISFHEVLGENTLSLVPRLVGILTKVPFCVFHRRHGYNLADGKIKVVIVVRSVFEDRFDCERRTGHLASRDAVTTDVVVVGGRLGSGARGRLAECK